MRVDQAENLRRLMEKQAKGVSLEFHNVVRSLFPPDASVFSLSAAKSDVLSLSLLAANLAWEIRRMGYRVAALDAHNEAVNTPFITGVSVPPSLDKFCRGGCDFNALRTSPEEGVFMMRGFGYVKEFNHWESGYRQVFLAGMKLLLNNSSGTVVFINELVPRFSMVLPKVILVFSSEQNSLLEAYRRLKKIKDVNPEARISFVITNVRLMQEAESLSRKFIDAARKFVGDTCEYLGCVVLSKEVVKSVKERIPLVVRYRYSRAAEEIRSTAKKILSAHTGVSVDR